jgi:hypothetical protein
MRGNDEPLSYWNAILAKGYVVKNEEGLRVHLDN